MLRRAEDAKMQWGLSEFEGSATDQQTEEGNIGTP